MQPTTTIANGAPLPAVGGRGSEGPGGTVIYMPVMAAPAATNFYERYRHRQSTVLGVCQVLIGILCIVFNAVGLAFYVYGTMFVGHGFWSGILFIVTGSIGISAGMKKTRGQIIGFMVTCILSAICAAPLLAFGILGTVISRPSTTYDCDYYRYNSRGHSLCNDSVDMDSYRVVVAMQALLAILAFIEAVLAIWGSAICCQAVCCCNPQPQTVMVPANYFTNDRQVMYMNQTQDMSYAYAQPLSANPYPQGQMPPPAYQTSFVQPPWSNPPQSTPLSMVSPSAPTFEGSHPPPYHSSVAGNQPAETAKY